MHRFWCSSLVAACFAIACGEPVARTVLPVDVATSYNPSQCGALFAVTVVEIA